MESRVRIAIMLIVVLVTAGCIGPVSLGSSDNSHPQTTTSSQPVSNGSYYEFPKKLLDSYKHHIKIENRQGNTHTVNVTVYENKSKQKTIRSEDSVKSPTGQSYSRLMTITGEHYLMVTSDTGSTTSLLTNRAVSDATISIQPNGDVRIINLK